MDFWPGWSTRDHIRIPIFRYFLGSSQLLGVSLNVVFNPSIRCVWSNSEHGPRLSNFDLSSRIHCILLTYWVLVIMTVALPLSGLMMTRFRSARSSLNILRCSRCKENSRSSGFVAANSWATAASSRLLSTASFEKGTYLPVLIDLWRISNSEKTFISGIRGGTPKSTPRQRSSFCSVVNLISVRLMMVSYELTAHPYLSRRRRLIDPLYFSSSAERCLRSLADSSHEKRTYSESERIFLASLYARRKLSSARSWFRRAFSSSSFTNARSITAEWKTLAFLTRRWTPLSATEFSGQTLLKKFYVEQNRI